jgi:hypothetical protein
MAKNDVVLEVLRFELKFLEDGGYGRSPRTPWRATNIFEDSPTCLNFGDPSHPHPCNECFLMQFVPEKKQGERVPCHFIPLTAKGETVDDFYRWGTQIEVEEALKNWLRKEIKRIEALEGSEQQTPKSLTPQT